MSDTEVIWVLVTKQNNLVIVYTMYLYHSLHLIFLSVIFNKMWNHHCIIARIFSTSSLSQLSFCFLGSNDAEKLAKSLHHNSLNFKYSTLEKATNSFDEANKLGQGGFGTVYKVIFASTNLHPHHILNLKTTLNNFIIAGSSGWWKRDCY